MTQNTPAEYFQTPVIELGVDRRAAFITRTYVHLFAAILAFAGIEIYLFSSGLAERLAASMLSVSWLWILGGFMVVGWLASRAAHTAKSPGAQYAALAGGAVLYDTSNVLHRFPEDRHVGAALELFASIALMFWYVLRLFMSRD